MNKMIQYERSVLIGKVPALKSYVESGQVTVWKLVTNEGKLLARIVRFLPGRASTIDDHLRQDIVTAVFKDCDPNIKYRVRRAGGVDLIGKPKDWIPKTI